MIQLHTSIAFIGRFSKQHGHHSGVLIGLYGFFPRASERRVLPIVGVCISSSHLHTFSSSHLLSHLLIFTSAHLHICSSSHLLSHLLIFTSAHLHIFSSSHLLIFTPSHLHIFSSSHLLIFTSAHLHIFLSSHLLIFTSAHLHISIFTYSHHLFLSLSRTHTFTYSHLLSLSLSLSLCPLSSLLSLSPFSLPFLSLAFFIFLSLGRGWCRRGVAKREPFRTK